MIWLCGVLVFVCVMLSSPNDGQSQATMAQGLGSRCLRRLDAQVTKKRSLATVPWKGHAVCRFLSVHWARLMTAEWDNSGQGPTPDHTTPFSQGRSSTRVRHKSGHRGRFVSLPRNARPLVYLWIADLCADGVFAMTVTGPPQRRHSHHSSGEAAAQGVTERGRSSRGIK